MIYLDNAATTQMFEEGAEIYKKYSCQSFFNASAGYGSAIEVKKEIDNVRKNILNKLGLKNGNIIFASGATEANNFAIFGSKRNGKFEYVFSEGEHPSVYNAAKELENMGYIVHFVKLQANGQIDYDALEKVLNEKTRLISTIHVNNETGAINDILKINKLREKFAPKALLHVDGVQAFCKIDCSLERANVDFYTISAHKFHGPKGVGALYVKNLNTIKPILFGGGQEEGFRSGTENVGGIMAMNYAIEKINVKENYQKVKSLNDRLIKNLKQDEHIHINSFEGSPYILTCQFENVNGETLMRALADKGVYVGTGSACSTKKAGNRVLQSMGLTKDNIKSNIRISLNEFLSFEEIDEACKIIIETFNFIRERVL